MRIAFLILVSLIAMNDRAWATPMKPDTGTGVSGLVGPSGGPFTIAGTSGLNNSSLTTTVISPIGGGSLTLNGSAAAGFGILKAADDVSINLFGTPETARSDAHGIFTDIITIEFAPWDGSPGTLNTFYTLSGTVLGSGVGSGFAEVTEFSLISVPDCPPNCSVPSIGSQDYSTSVSGIFPGAPIPFIYGQPFVFGFELSSVVGTLILKADGIHSSQVVGIGSANADFSNTFVLSGLVPTDANGNEAFGATFTSGSGTQYGFNGVTLAPEPGSIVLLATGLVAAASKFRRRWTPRISQ